MAGMPPGVLERANEMLARLEKSPRDPGDKRSGIRDPGSKKEDLHKNLSRIAHRESTKTEENFQLSFIQLDDPLLEQIKQDILNTEINTLTPVEALMKLNEIKKLLEKK